MPTPRWRDLRSRPTLLVGAATTLLWLPLATTVPQSGLDPSWRVGLSMGHVDGLQVGPDLLFTYGPWGPLAAPQVVWMPGAVLGVLFAAGSAFAVAALAFWWARCWLPPVAAGALVVVGGVVLPQVGVPELGAIAATLAAAAAVTPDRLDAPLPWWVPAGLGAVAALELQVKVSVGGYLVALAAVVVLSRPGRARTAAIAAGTFVAAGAALWLLAGQRLGSLLPWLSGAARIASGYDEAMSLAGDRRLWVPLVLVVAVLLGGVGVVLRRERLRAAPWALVLLLATWFLVKAGYVRLDPPHATIAVAGLSLLAVVLPWSGRARWAGAAVVLVGPLFLVGAQARATHRPVAATAVDLAARGFDGAAEAVRVGRDAVDADRRAERLDRAAAEVRAAYGVDPEVLAAVPEGATVHADPVDAALVWAAGLGWDPVPTFQAYSAYDPRLDAGNAEHLASPEGPDAVLHRAYAIDGRLSAWQAPEQQVALTCHFEVVRRRGPWSALVRTDDRCGAATTLAEVEVDEGEEVEVPQPEDPDALVVATFDLPADPVTAVAGTLLKPLGHPRVSLDGDQHRFVAATAASPHLLRVPDDPSLAWPALDVDLLALEGTNGPVTVTFEELPLR